MDIRSFDPTSREPLFGISVAADLTGVKPPMLRVYEAKGLIGPHRTDGGTRIYSQADLTTVNRISTLLAAGLNLAGVEAVLELEAEAQILRAQITDMQAANRAAARRAEAADGGR